MCDFKLHSAFAMIQIETKASQICWHNHTNIKALNADRIHVYLGLTQLWASIIASEIDFYPQIAGWSIA